VMQIFDQWWCTRWGYFPCWPIHWVPLGPIPPCFAAGHSGDLWHLSSGDPPGRDRQRQKHAGAADDFGTGAPAGMDHRRGI
jgi:hypothetical protein